MPWVGSGRWSKREAEGLQISGNMVLWGGENHAGNSGRSIPRDEGGCRAAGRKASRLCERCDIRTPSPDEESRLTMVATPSATAESAQERDEKDPSAHPGGIRAD
jgi:hypothetical protein